jgi:hypothetical protein
MYEQLVDLAEWGTSKPTLVYCATIWCVPLTKTTSNGRLHQRELNLWRHQPVRVSRQEKAQD